MIMLLLLQNYVLLQVIVLLKKLILLRNLELHSLTLDLLEPSEQTENICEDRYIIPQSLHSFSGTMATGVTIRFLYTLRNINSVKVPFFDSLEVVTLSISNNTPNCAKKGTGTVTNYERYLDFLCTGTGTGTITITGRSGTYPASFTIKAMTVSSVIAHGHDSVAFKSGETIFFISELCLQE